MRYHLNNDYSEAVHPKILEAIGAATTGNQYPGYGVDEHCERAARLIREAAESPDCDVHFMVGGTQTNTVVIGSALRPWEAVISTHVGHVNVHETGAIESTGHKVCTVHCEDGKLTPAAVESVLRGHFSEHMVVPRMVYISNTTELGTIYTKAELQELSAFCRARDLIFFLDGARLGSALASAENDVTLRDLVELTDCFYIGGTKNGAMFGEALVIRTPKLKEDIRFYIKQRGALLAKGYLLGVQFEQLFTNNLFLELGAHANKTAAILRDGLLECDVTLISDSHSNQLFPILSNALIEQLHKSFVFSVQEEIPDTTDSVCRLCTSWATREDECHRFVSLLKELRSIN